MTVGVLEILEMVMDSWGSGGDNGRETDGKGNDADSCDSNKNSNEDRNGGGGSNGDSELSLYFQTLLYWDLVLVILDNF